MLTDNLVKSNEQTRGLGDHLSNPALWLLTSYPKTSATAAAAGIVTVLYYYREPISKFFHERNFFWQGGKAVKPGESRQEQKAPSLTDNKQIMEGLPAESNPIQSQIATTEAKGNEQRMVFK
jgi:hypothetical protein